MKKFTFDDLYKELDEYYVPYDILYQGQIRRLGDITRSANNYKVIHTVEAGDKLVEKILNSGYNPLFGNEIEYEYIIKLLYNKKKLDNILENNKEFDIEPNKRYVELTLDSIYLVDEDERVDITDYNDKMFEFYYKNENPIIVNYIDLIDTLKKNKTSNTFASIDEMKELVKDEGLITEKPVIKTKIKKLYN